MKAILFRIRLAILLLGIFLLGIAMAPMEAKANTLSTSAGVNGQFEGCGQTGTTSAACQTTGSVIVGLGTASFGGSASARSAYGDLGTAASGLASCAGVAAPYNCFTVNGGSSAANATFDDTFTVSSGPASGFLVFHAFAEGTSSVTCIGPNAAELCGGAYSSTSLAVNGGSGLINGVAGTLGLGNGIQQLTITVPYTSSAADVGFGLASVAACLSGASNDTNCNAFTNFFDTFGITGVSVEDSNGVVDPSATLTTQSGTDYNSLSFVSTPEPGTLTLLGTGLFGLGALRRKFRKSS